MTEAMLSMGFYDLEKKFKNVQILRGKAKLSLAISFWREYGIVWF